MANNSQGGTVADRLFVSVKELKRIVGVRSDETIKAMVDKQQIPPPRKLGAKLLWPRRELAEALGIEL
jgi:predicted DNA-binding transcriptional regulator AlpA